MFGLLTGIAVLAISLWVFITRSWFNIMGFITRLWNMCARKRSPTAPRRTLRSISARSRGNPGAAPPGARAQLL
jgi:hypothetical protein